MTALAFGGHIMDSRTLARSVNTNPVVVRRLLAMLRRANLFETCAGRHGGARLHKRPSRISLLDIYDAIEPRPVIAMTHRKVSRHCPVSCNMKQIMEAVAESADRGLRSRLREIKLEQLV